MIKKLLLVVAALSLLIPVLACAPGGPAEPEVIKIGCICTKTGDLGPMGMRMFQGAELAVDEINAKGGILGKRVVLLEEDDATDGAKSLERVKKLVEVKGVKVTIGAWFGESSGATAPYA